MRFAHLKGERIIKDANGFFFLEKKEKGMLKEKNVFRYVECGNFFQQLISEAIMHDFHEVYKNKK